MPTYNLTEPKTINAERLAKAFRLGDAAQGIGPAVEIYQSISGLSKGETSNKITDEAIIKLEELMQIFEMSKYIRAHKAGTIEDTMGIKVLDISPIDGEDAPTKPITFKVSGYAIRAISFTMTAIKSLPDNSPNNIDKAQNLIHNLITLHENLSTSEMIAEFASNDQKTQEKVSIKAHNLLYDFKMQQAKTLDYSLEPDPLYKRLSIHKIDKKSKKASKLKKQTKALGASDDCQLITRPVVRAQKQIGNITITQIFTPVIHMTERQKDDWRKVANDKLREASSESSSEIRWFNNFPKQFQQEYITMAKDAVALEAIHNSNKTDMKEFKEQVANSQDISHRMKARIAKDLTSNKTFEDFDPFFVLAQTASSGNRCSPQASNFVQIHTIIAKNGKFIRQDKSYTRSNENMLADPRYNKDSNYAPEGGEELSPFWQQSNFSKDIASIFQSAASKEEAGSLVKDATKTVEQIYHNHIAEIVWTDDTRKTKNEAKTKENIDKIKKDLDKKYAKHWGFKINDSHYEKGYKEITTVVSPQSGGNTLTFKHKPILFSSSLLSTLPGPLENSALTSTIFHAPDRNRMMFFQKLAAFGNLENTSEDRLCGKLIVMNFGVNDYRKQTMMGFRKVMDKQNNRHEGAKLTLAVLNNLIVGVDRNDKLAVKTQQEEKQLGIRDNLINIYRMIESETDINENKSDLDKVSTTAIDRLGEALVAIKEKDGKAANNAKLAIAATKAFIETFKERAIPKSANEHIMMACYANLMVQSSSGEASQTDQHCKSGRDRTYTTQLHEQAMKVYFDTYGKLPTPDDTNSEKVKCTDEAKKEIVKGAREAFIDIFEECFFLGTGQENSNQNQHGSFGLQNLTLRRPWPNCLIFGTINPDETCMLPTDIKQRLEKRDPGLKNNKHLRNLGKMSKKMKEKDKPKAKKAIDAVTKLATNTVKLAISPLFVLGIPLFIITLVASGISKLISKATNKKGLMKNSIKAGGSISGDLLSLGLPIFALAFAPLIVLGPPLLLCCKFTGSRWPKYNPIFTGGLLFLAVSALAVGAFFLSPAIIPSAAIVQVVLALAVAALYIIGAMGLNPDKQNKSIDIYSTVFLAAAATLMIMFSPALSLALPVFLIPIVAAVAATAVYSLFEHFMPHKDSVKEDSEKANWYSPVITATILTVAILVIFSPVMSLPLPAIIAIAATATLMYTITAKVLDNKSKKHDPYQKNLLQYNENHLSRNSEDLEPHPLSDAAHNEKRTNNLTHTFNAIVGRSDSSKSLSSERSSDSTALLLGGNSDPSHTSRPNSIRSISSNTGHYDANNYGITNTEAKGNNNNSDEGNLTVTMGHPPKAPSNPSQGNP